MKLIGRNGRFRQAFEFLLVGGGAFIIDAGLFNLLITAGLDSMIAKIWSVTAAVIASYFGNRYFAFSAERSERVVSEVVSFAVVNLLAGGISVLCVFVSHYLLGFTSIAADNISGNLVGVALGTSMRFWCYRTIVFRASSAPSLVMAGNSA